MTVAEASVSVAAACEEAGVAEACSGSKLAYGVLSECSCYQGCVGGSLLGHAVLGSLVALAIESLHLIISNRFRLALKVFVSDTSAERCGPMGPLPPETLCLNCRQAPAVTFVCLVVRLRASLSSLWRL